MFQGDSAFKIVWIVVQLLTSAETWPVHQLMLQHQFTLIDRKKEEKEKIEIVAKALPQDMHNQFKILTKKSVQCDDEQCILLFGNTSEATSFVMDLDIARLVDNGRLLAELNSTNYESCDLCQTGCKCSVRTVELNRVVIAFNSNPTDSLRMENVFEHFYLHVNRIYEANSIIYNHGSEFKIAKRGAEVVTTNVKIVALIMHQLNNE